MGYFKRSGAFRISFAEIDGSDNWVDIHDERTHGQWCDELQLWSRVRAGRKEALPDDVDYLANRVSYLAAAIIDWSLRDDDGQPVPPSTEALTDLDSEIAMKLFTAISGHYAPTVLDEDEKKVLSEIFTEPSELEETSPSDSELLPWPVR